MTYKEIKNKIKTSEGLIELLNYYNQYFNKLETIENSLEINTLELPSAKQFLQIVTVCDLKISKICAILKEDIELKEISVIKKEHDMAQSNQERFYVSATKKIVKDKTKKERRMLNIFEMYLKNCETLRFSLQSIIKSLISEIRGLEYEV